MNYLAILVAGVASMVVGSFWYGPLFGKLWITLSGMSPEKMQEAKARGMTKPYSIAFLGSLVMAYVLSYLASALGLSGVGGAFSLTFWTWLGFIVTVQINPVLWQNQPVKLFYLNIAHYFVAIFVMSLIVVLWV